MAVVIRGKELSCCGMGSAGGRTAIGSLPCLLPNERRATTPVLAPVQIVHRVWKSFRSARMGERATFGDK